MTRRRRCSLGWPWLAVAVSKRRLMRGGAQGLSYKNASQDNILLILSDALLMANLFSARVQNPGWEVTAASVQVGKMSKAPPLRILTPILRARRGSTHLRYLHVELLDEAVQAVHPFPAGTCRTKQMCMRTIQLTRQTTD